MRDSFHGRKPKVGHLRAIGCKTWYHVPNEKRKKLDPKGRVGVLLGYDKTNDKAYIILDLEERKIIRSRDVKFDEAVFPFNNALQDDFGEESDEENVEE